MAKQSKGEVTLEDDVIFNEALPVFEEQFLNLVFVRNNELSLKMTETFERMARHGGFVNTLPIRYKLYEEHAKNIGDDFLKIFDEFIHPHCQNISDSSWSRLFGVFTQTITLIKNRAESEIKSVLSARANGENDLKPAIVRVQYIYTACESIYGHSLDARIAKHNFEIDIKKKKDEPVEKEPPKDENQVHKAVEWCYIEYKKKGGKKNKKINKRGIAVDAVKNFFPSLEGKSRLRMIDNLRNSYLNKAN
jgi:hypothetical protein